MKNIINWYSRLNIYYKLTPFLLLYLIICVINSTNTLVGDEGRYLWFANNLLRGFYSSPYPAINLWNGPGYPLFLAPFIFLKLPLIALRLLNGFLLYFSLIISYKTLRFYCSKRSASFNILILGLYLPILGNLSFILTECLAWLLISLVCLLFIKCYALKRISWKLIILTAFSIAFLAMTKIIFGYVIILMLIVSLLAILMPLFRPSAKKSTLIFLISFVFCLPWLFYTYSITNKIIYWTNSGSMSMYTMSTPFATELGDWNSEDSLQKNPNHKVFIDSIKKLNPLEKDEVYKKAALENIKNHPRKFVSNWFANVGRLFFSYPYSNTEQKMSTYFYIIPNIFFIVIILLIFPFCIKHYTKFPPELILLFLFTFIYLAGSTLISAYPRMFTISIPFWVIIISFVFNNIITIKIKHD